MKEKLVKIEEIGWCSIKECIGEIVPLNLIDDTKCSASETFSSDGTWLESSFSS